MDWLTDSGTAEREPLSRERVLHAAIKLADRGGIEALTMRTLGQELGVEAMSLYNHVANKDDILDEIVEMVICEIDPPSNETDWKTAIRKSAISAHKALLRHPWACRLMLSRTNIRSARLRWMDSILGSLREAGFSAELTCHAYHALDSHITGFTLWVASFPAAEELRDLAATFLQELPVDEYPYVAEHIEQHLRESSDNDEGEYEFGLDLILDGLEKMRLGTS